MRKQIVFLLAVTLVGLQCNASGASRCLQPRSVSDELKNSTAVFSGIAIAEEYRPVDIKRDSMLEGGEALVIRFAVEHWWKGSRDAEVILHTGVTRYPNGIISFFSEDFTFQIGEKYLVYADTSGGNLRTDGCRRTKKLEKAEEDLRDLGEGKLPVRRDDKSQHEKFQETKP